MARTRNVFPTTEIAHLWAAWADEPATAKAYARNPQSNFWFDHGALYSYRTRIAQVMLNPEATTANNAAAVLITTSRYSNTTAKHLGDARSAMSHFQRFTVPNLDARLGMGADSDAHHENLSAYESEVAELRGKAKRARTNRDYYLAQAEGKENEANRYAAFFGFPAAFNVEALGTARQAREAERARYVAEQKVLQEAAREAARIDGALAAEAWKRGLPYYTDAEGESRHTARAMWNYPDTLLRVEHGDEADGDEVVTSRGARVPYADALRLYRALERHEARQGDKVGPYRFNSESDEGVTIGCHFIGRAEVARFAATQGWNVTPAPQVSEGFQTMMDGLVGM